MTAPQPRTAARIFLLDDRDRVLLVHQRLDLDRVDSHWITPGGGLEDGETLTEAAVREVYEETGLQVELPAVAEPVFVEREVFSFAGQQIDQVNYYFLARVASDAPVQPIAPTEYEAVISLGSRWWPLEELETAPVGPHSARYGRRDPASVGGGLMAPRRNGIAAARRTSAPRSKVPTLRYEREMWRSGAGLLAAVDEVGRGALAGPVTVGVVLLAADTKPAPFGVADSKLLTPQARLRLVPRIRRWALDCAVGHASAAEIDQIGIIAALRLAAERAVSQLSLTPEWVLLDGNYDYLTPPANLELFGLPGLPAEPDRWRCGVPVRTLIKGDMRCSSIAAASVLAKTERDAMLISYAEQYPQYGFAENKAYASREHLAALAEHGPCEIHRCSWNLPGLAARLAEGELDLLEDELAAAQDGLDLAGLAPSGGDLARSGDDLARSGDDLGKSGAEWNLADVPAALIADRGDGR